MAGDADSPKAADALERLCRAYWYPLYAYVRRRGYSSHEAEDLTQEFFSRLIERKFPTGVKREGGKFRSYLLAALQRFLANEWEARQTAKRGGGKSFLSLEELEAGKLYDLEPAVQMTPEQLFERRWASTLLAQARQKLRDEYSAVGKAALYTRLEPCLTGAERLIAYQQLAEELGIGESGVKMAVHRLRKRFGELLREEIMQTVSSPEDIEEEIRCLILAAAQ